MLPIFFVLHTVITILFFIFAILYEMSEVLQANIFFLITGLAVTIFTLFLCIGMVHVIKLLQSIRRIVARIEEGAEVLGDDVQKFRAHMSGGGVVRKFFHFLFAKPDEANDTADATEVNSTKTSGRKGAVKR